METQPYFGYISTLLLKRYLIISKLHVTTVAASRQTNLLLLVEGEELVLEENHFERFKNGYLIKSLAFRRKHYTFADEQEPKI